TCEAAAVYSQPQAGGLGATMQRGRQNKRRSPGRWLLIAALAAAGCAAPVGVKRISVGEEHSEINRTALTSPEPSDVSQIILRRYNLVPLFQEHPQQALSQLREVVISGRGGNDELFALAELSYLYAAQTESRADALAAAVYAYAYLFPDDEADQPSAIDPRYRWACDIYAEGLTETLRERDGHDLQLESGVYPLPFGWLTMNFDSTDLVWGSRRLKDFVPVGEYAIEGLNNRYRQPGIGVALAAQTEKIG